MKSLDAGAAAALIVLVLVGCGDPPLFELVVSTPEGVDPLADVDSLRLLVTNPADQTSEVVQETKSFSVELTLEVHGEVGSVALEGYRAQEMVARGETPPMVLQSADYQITLLVAKAGALSALKPRLEQPAAQMATALVPGSGVLMAGGADAASKPLTRAALYDFLAHQLVKLPALPTPRMGAVGAHCGSGCALVVTGADAQGLAAQILRFDGSAWRAFDDGLSPVDRRQGAAIAALEDGTYLLFGGEGPAGPTNSVLSLDYASDGTPGMSVLPVRAGATRSHPALAVSTGVVLVAGGQGAGQPAVELFYTTSASFQSVSLPGPTLASGAAAVDLPDKRLAIIGGVDENGVLLRDGWIVDPVTLKVTHVSDVLGQGRSGHRVLRLGQRLVVLGGRQDTGLAAHAEVLSATDLSAVKQTPMVRPREAFGLVQIGAGSLLVLGGVDDVGGVDQIEVYETAVRCE